MSDYKVTFLGQELTAFPADAEISVTVPAKRVDVGNCARCAGNHDKLEFTMFRRPVEVFDDDDKLIRSWTDFALCPTTGEPILLSSWGNDNDGKVVP